MNGDVRFNTCKSQQELSDEEIDKLLSAQQARNDLHPSGCIPYAQGLRRSGRRVARAPPARAAAVRAMRWIYPAHVRHRRSASRLGTVSPSSPFALPCVQTQLLAPHPSPSLHSSCPPLRWTQAGKDDGIWRHEP
jgi:hypothetical protein